jgi:integrase
MRAGNYSERTIELRRFQISHLADEILRKNPFRVKTHELTGWLARQDWEPETRKSWLAALRGFYGWAVEQGYTRHNPAAKLPKVTVSDAIPRPAPDAVLTAALGRCATDCDRLVLALAAYAGLRRAEIAALRWDQIADGVIRIRGKGRRVRLIPLDDELATELAVEQARRDDDGHGTGFRYTTGLADGYVFGGRNGSHMSPNTVGRIAKRLLGDGYSIHTLRHSFLTHALNGTGDLAAVQELAGHASPKTTRGYTRVDTRRLVAAVRAVRR